MLYEEKKRLLRNDGGVLEEIAFRAAPLRELRRALALLLHQSVVTGWPERRVPDYHN